MRGLYCLIIFLFTMFVPSFAQNGEVDGYVHEQGTSLPINKAIITICNQKSSVLYSCVTNKEVVHKGRRIVSLYLESFMHGV